MVKKVSLGGEYAKKGVDIDNGDVVKILNSGTTVDGQFGEQFVFSIETKNGEKNANFNQASVNILVDEFGEDSEDWVGKEVTVRMKKDTIGGKKVTIAYFCTPEWDFDEYRELVKNETGGEVTGEDVGF